MEEQLFMRYPILLIILAGVLVANNIWQFYPCPVDYFPSILFTVIGSFGIIHNALLNRLRRRAIAEAHKANTEQWQEDLRQ